MSVAVTDLGGHVRVLLPIVGGMSEKPAALEAFGRGVREGTGQRLGVIPKPKPTQIPRVLPVQPGLTKFHEISMICSTRKREQIRCFVQRKLTKVELLWRKNPLDLVW